MKNVPWISLILLLTANSSFGWLLALYSLFPRVGAAILVFLIALFLTTPFTNLKVCLNQVLKSDTTAFSFAIIAAFFSVFLLSWIEVVVHFFILFSAGALVRLDLQNTGCSSKQAFWMLSVISLGGFILGLGIHLAILNTLH